MSDKATIIQIRNKTGAGIMDIKEALEAAGGDEDKALELLRKKGQKIAAKRAERDAGEGWVGSYVHATGKVAALVRLQCETDFVARNPQFQELAHDIAMHVVAANPVYLNPSDVPAEIIEKEREIYREEAGTDKPAEILEKIVEGKVAKYFAETCLIEQPFIKDDSRTIRQLIEEATAAIGEKIEIGGFSREQI